MKVLKLKQYHRMLCSKKNNSDQKLSIGYIPDVVEAFLIGAALEKSLKEYFDSFFSKKMDFEAKIESFEDFISEENLTLLMTVNEEKHLEIELQFDQESDQKWFLIIKELDN